LWPIRRRRVWDALPAGTLGIKPGVDVTFAEPPLAADTNGGNLAGLDEPVHRAKVDLEVFQDFFSRQEDFVVRKIHAH